MICFNSVQCRLMDIARICQRRPIPTTSPVSQRHSVADYFHSSTYPFSFTTVSSHCSTVQASSKIVLIVSVISRNRFIDRVQVQKHWMTICQLTNHSPLIRSILVSLIPSVTLRRKSFHLPITLAFKSSILVLVPHFSICSTQTSTLSLYVLLPRHLWFFFSRPPVQALRP